MKKILLSLGAVATITAPIATVVACGKDDSKTTTKESEDKVTKTGSEDKTTKAGREEQNIETTIDKAAKEMQKRNLELANLDEMNFMHELKDILKGETNKIPLLGDKKDIDINDEFIAKVNNFYSLEENEKTDDWYSDFLKEGEDEKVAVLLKEHYKDN